MPFKKGQSGNPNGKPKGAISTCTKAKADYFKVYQKLEEMMVDATEAG